MLLFVADDVRLCWLPAVSPTFSGLLVSNCFPFTMDDLSLAQSNTTCPVLSRIDDDAVDVCGGKDDDVIVTFMGRCCDTFYLIDCRACG